MHSFFETRCRSAATLCCQEEIDLCNKKIGNLGAGGPGAASSVSPFD